MIESSFTLEHSEAFPASSVAVPKKVVVVLSATGTVKPIEPKSAAEPDAAGVPLQEPSVNRSTVELDSAEPKIDGLLLSDPDGGLVPSNVGGFGATVSTSTVRFPDGFDVPTPFVAVAWTE